MINKINIKLIESIAADAGTEIMNIYEKEFEVEYKKDNSPLTEADLKSNKIICDSLTNYFPEIPILSEENTEIPFSHRSKWDYYWCIDPIDGTKEFIKKNDEFTVNIALIHKNQPVLGVVYAPALNKMYSAKQGEGAFLNSQKLPLNNVSNQFVVVASKSHLSVETEKFIDRLKNNFSDVEIDSKGSSLKLCMIAEGSATIYPRLAPTMEWDTAAADAIVRESGKMTYKYDSTKSPLDYLNNKNDLEELPYNKKNLLNSFFVVV